ncbi:uncharacterized protein LOC104883469 [Beta vulgaris subsp. vulgaris]|uniref:uncharacterized protein LOC104883469 n=1 Tax=Beta vulgaris subsp. vulgaris TaxID=3555 RepID=UPI00053FD8A2|nr:uncharacterized protein LOC104883469 [Beta vulgaris subsp. vulgaris]
MKRVERSWMYNRVDGGLLRTEFVNGVQEFIEFATQHQLHKDSNQIRCPCQKCNNRRFLDVETVKEHLYRRGFCHSYFEWICHGENNISQLLVEQSNPYQDMIVDAFGSLHENLNHNVGDEVEEEPNDEAKKFFDLLKASKDPLYEGSKMSVLEMVARITALKCEYNLPHRCVDAFASLVNEAIPNNNLMSRTFYDTKKVLKGLQLPHEKIHTCPNGCMLFWKNDAHLEQCKVCGSDRYKKTSRGKLIPVKVLTYFPITPRLQRLYATNNIAKEMTWHHTNPRARGTMAHPSDGDAWKHFNDTYPDFASEPRNVRLGLCTDGFTPYGKFGGNYSCWPVILTPYNLPPSMCMKKPFMFLSLIVPGPKNPKGNIDVYMQPLVEELKQLWEYGASTYDISKKQNFNLRAALMWTISDFPAYGMLSGWATAGKKACPYCMDKSKAFWLQNGGKVTWFDCHCQYLPQNHPFRKNKKAFRKNMVEKDDPPPNLCGEDVWKCVSMLPKTTDGPEALKRLKKEKMGWFKQSIFWELPYWKDLLIRHNLDVMHIEKKDDYEKKVAEYKEKDINKDPNEVYLEVVGGRKKGLVPGLGCSGDLWFKKSISRTNNSSTTAYTPSLLSQLSSQLKQSQIQLEQSQQQANERMVELERKQAEYEKKCEQLENERIAVERERIKSHQENQEEMRKFMEYIEVMKRQVLESSKE